MWLYEIAILIADSPLELSVMIESGNFAAMLTLEVDSLIFLLILLNISIYLSVEKYCYIFVDFINYTARVINYSRKILLFFFVIDE